MPSKTSTLHSQVCLTIRNKLNRLAFSVIQFWLWSSKLRLLESARTSEDHIHGYILWPWGATPGRQITMVRHGQKKYIINSKPIRKGKGKKNDNHNWENFIFFNDGNGIWTCLVFMTNSVFYSLFFSFSLWMEPIRSRWNCSSVSKIRHYEFMNNRGFTSNQINK